MDILRKDKDFDDFVKDLCNITITFLTLSKFNKWKNKQKG